MAISATRSVIIMDIDLNTESGSICVEELAEEGVTAPVIYITGNDSPVNRAGCDSSRAVLPI